jgi:hypothetical protein
MSSVGVEGPRKRDLSIELSSRWHVAQTHPHAEAKASLHLRRQGFEIYLPRYLKSRRHRVRSTPPTGLF